MGRVKDFVHIRGGPRLGVVDWLWTSLSSAVGPVMWTSGEVGEGQVAEELERLAKARLEAGAAIVIGGWPGLDEAREATRVELIGRPMGLGLIAADGSRLRAAAAPDFGPPDMVLDDHAPWAIAAATVTRVRVDVIGAGPACEPALTPRGVAWLVQWATGRHADLSAPEIEALLETAT